MRLAVLIGSAWAVFSARSGTDAALYTGVKEVRKAAGMREAGAAGELRQGAVAASEGWQSDDEIDDGALRILTMPAAVSALRVGDAPPTISTQHDASPFQQQVLGHPSREQREQCVQKWANEDGREHYSFDCIHAGENSAAGYITEKETCEKSYMMRHRHMDLSGTAGGSEADTDCYLQGEIVGCCYDCDSIASPGSVNGAPRGDERANCMPSGDHFICPAEDAVLVGCGDDPAEATNGNRPTASSSR